MLVEQVALGTDGDHGAHRVEEVGQQQGEDQEDHRDDPDLVHTAQQAEVAQRRQARQVHREAVQARLGQGPAGEVERALLRVVVEGAQVSDGVDDDGQDRGRGDADEDGAADLAHVEHHHEEEPEEEDEDRPALEGAAQAQFQGGAAAAHHLGVHQADERDEQADAHGDRGLELVGDGLEDGLPETGEHQDEDDDALDDDEAHGVGVGHALGAHEGVGDHRVDPQARGQGHRVVGDDAHEDRHDRGDEGGAGGELGLGSRGARLGQDRGVEDEDVAHREEGDDAATDLSGDARTAFSDVEEPIQSRDLTGRGRR